MDAFRDFLLQYVGTILLLILFAALIIPICVLPLIAKKKASRKTTSATVFSKTQDNRRTASLYYIAFLFPDGTRKNMQVTVSEYNTIRKGEEGVLVYKEYKNYVWLESFRPTSQKNT